jgi:predicted dehydrogenase
MSDRAVRFGLVGAGGIARTYARAFEDCPEARVVGVADVRAEAAGALAERLGCPAYESHHPLAADRPDAVVVCTPPATHAEVGLHFLERRIPVLCEKPLCLGVAEARRMIDAARAAGVLVTMASPFRHAADVVRARALVAAGGVGPVVLCENAFTARVDMSGRWNAVPPVGGGGVLIDHGTDSVDLLRYLLGPIAEVQAVEGKRVQALAVEDTARLLVRTAGGVLGSVDLSWSIDKCQEGYLNVHGARGTLSVGWKASWHRPAGAGEAEVFGRGYDEDQAVRDQLTNFAHAVRGEEGLRLTAEDALASVAVLEAAYASLRQNRWTAVAPFLDAPAGAFSSAARVAA